jgi:hypothetical protein
MIENKDDLRFYYYPLSSKDFTFENIFATESISPPSYYSKRGFGFDYFFQLPLHSNDVIVLFNAIPAYTVDTEISKFVLAISEKALDLEDVILIDEGIIGYPKTIYLDRNNFKILFFSEKEKKTLILKSELSLPTKGLVKYVDNFLIISEDDCQPFDLNSLKAIEIVGNEADNEIFYDRRYNSIKGLVYGLAIGLLSSNSSGVFSLKKGLQEITDSFAELKNRVENSSKAKDSKFGFSLSSYENKLREAIKKSEESFLDLFPIQIITEDKLVSFLRNKFNDRFQTDYEAQQFLNRIVVEDKLFAEDRLSQIKSIYVEESGNKSPYLFFEEIKLLASRYSKPLTSKSNVSIKSRDDINDRVKRNLSELGKIIEQEILRSSQNNELTLKGVRYYLQNNRIEISEGFQNLSHAEVTEFEIILNIVLSNSKKGKGSVGKETLLLIVAAVTRALNKNMSPQSSMLYQYLNDELNSYSVDRVASIVMKNFVAFIFNPDSLEKLQSYLEVKGVDQRWMAYAFWCAFTGFANTSKNFLKPVFESSNHQIQDYIDDFLKEQIGGKNFRKTTWELKETINEKLIGNESNREKREEYYDKFIRTRYPKLSRELFESVINMTDEGQRYEALKKHCNIIKKEAKKILGAYTEFVNHPNLF